MNVFAIGDLHLPGGNAKPMDIFGPHWENHFEQIRADWRMRVSESDLVLIPGDISWAMYLQEALEDLKAIAALPGKKVLLRGNHDYWWSAIGRVRTALPKQMYALQNDSLQFDNVLVCGARGWLCPDFGSVAAKDVHIYQRELIRLRLSLDHAVKRMQGAKHMRLIAMLHFPPLTEQVRESEVTRLLEAYPVQDVVYGHLHGAGLAGAFTGLQNGIRYHQVSCDYLRFALHALPPA